MEEIFVSIFGFGVLGLLIGILIIVLMCKFIIYLIKCGTKNAIVEVIDEDTFYDNIKFSVAEGVLLALEQYNNGNQKERPTE